VSLRGDVEGLANSGRQRRGSGVVDRISWLVAILDKIHVFGLCSTFIGNIVAERAKATQEDITRQQEQTLLEELALDSSYPS
jgi:hypothetical protein